MVATAVDLPATTRPAFVPSRLESLTGLRFFAAAGVVVAHLGLSLGGREGAHTRGLAALGWMGVSFFFVLSGFLLTWRARPGDSAVTFYRRRLARIYPAYLAALLAAAAIGAAVEHAPVNREGLLASVFLVQAWVPRLDIFMSVNAVGWSLSAEAFFYLLWPVLVPRIARLTTATRLRLAAALGAVIVAIGSFGSVTTHGNPAELLGHWQAWLVYVCPAARLPEFLIGAILATLVRDGWRPRWGFRQATALLAAAYVAVHLHPMMADTVAIPFVALAGIVLAAALTDLEGRPCWLRTRALGWLGAASYCLYLVHELPLRVFVHHFPSPAGTIGIAFVIAVPLAGLALAGLLHELVEDPAEAHLKGTSPRPIHQV